MRFKLFIDGKKRYAGDLYFGETSLEEVILKVNGLVLYKLEKPKEEKKND